MLCQEKLTNMNLPCLVGVSLRMQDLRLKEVGRKFIHGDDGLSGIWDLVVSAANAATISIGASVHNTFFVSMSFNAVGL
jgi:hypothetical protein